MKSLILFITVVIGSLSYSPGARAEEADALFGAAFGCVGGGAMGHFIGSLPGLARNNKAMMNAGGAVGAVVGCAILAPELYSMGARAEGAPAQEQMNQDTEQSEE